jgi:hypothetical protein
MSPKVDQEALDRAVQDVVFPDEASARSYAERQQAQSREAETEWIYLHRDWDQQWVARPWKPQPLLPPSEPRSLRSSMFWGTVGYALNPFNWF